MRRLLVCIACACYAPDPAPCTIQCTASCPGSMTCGADGYCHGDSSEPCASAMVELDIGLDGDGHGAVRSTAPDFTCPPKCKAVLPAGTMLFLDALPGLESDFTSWSDPACGSQGSCAFTIDRASSISATFVGNQFVIAPATPLYLIEGETRTIDVTTAFPPDADFGVTAAASAGLTALPTSFTATTAVTPQTLTLTAPVDRNTTEDAANLTLTAVATTATVPVQLIDASQLSYLGWHDDLGATVPLGADTAIAYPITVSQPVHLLGEGVVSVGALGQARFALYLDDGAGHPGPLMTGGDAVYLLPSGTDDPQPTSTFLVPPGDYWLAIRVNTNAQLRGSATTTPACSASSIFEAAWPDPFPAPACAPAAMLDLYATVF